MAKQKIRSAKGEVKFPSYDGTRIKFDLSFDPTDPEYLAYVEELQAAEDDFEKKYRGVKFIKEDTDYDRKTKEKTPNGRTRISYGWAKEFTNKETGEKHKNSPVFFDSQLNKIDPVQLWWGTICRVTCTLRSYNKDGKVGITRDVVAIQILDLTEGGVTAESAGFKAEEGGFTAAAKKLTERPWDDEEENVA